MKALQSCEEMVNIYQSTRLMFQESLNIQYRTVVQKRTVGHLKVGTHS